MLLGVIGRTDDPLVEHTSAVAEQRGHEVAVLSFADVAAGLPVALSIDASRTAFTVADGDVSRCDALVVRSFPATFAMLAPAGTSLLAEAYFRLAAQQNERSSFAQSVLLSLECLQKPMVNRLSAMLAFDHKPHQLAQLASAGIPLPRTCITNDPVLARAFIERERGQGGEVIAKPAAGGAETVLVDERLLSRLDGIEASPVIFQQRVPGKDIRVTVVGDRIASVVHIVSDVVDYRAAPHYRAGQAQYLAHELPEAVASFCLNAARRCGFALAGIDLRVDDEQYVLLEVNSAPVYLDIEHKLGHPITQSLVEHLEAAVG